MTEIRIPDIGDFKDVAVIDILVQPGQAVSVEDGIITLETDKASVDVPTPVRGTVKEILVKLGDKVNQGDTIATLDEAEQAKDPAPVPATAPPGGTGGTGPEQTVSVPDIGDFKDVEVIDILVQAGQDVIAEEGILTIETDKASLDIPAPVSGKIKEMLAKKGDKVSQGSAIAIIFPATGTQPTPTPVSAAPAPAAPAPATPPAPVAAVTADAGQVIYASPAVRKIGREFGVALAQVKGSGTKGRILKEDVQAYVRNQLQQGGGSAGPALGYDLPPLEAEDFSKGGPVEEEQLSRIRQLSGPVLHRNWLAVPHVTQFDDADVTELEAFRKSHAAEAKAKGFSLSPLAFLVKAVTVALREFPEFNSSLQPDGKSIIIKKYFNIGIAVDTPGGLMVPVLHGADTMTVMGIAEEMARLSDKARKNKVGPKELRGGTFTISSLGGIGGAHFTPIVNLPEVAILGVGKARTCPVWNGNEFTPRLLMPLTLSYDHRVIDGAKGARFTTHLSMLLSDIRNIVL